MNSESCLRRVYNLAHGQWSVNIIRDADEGGVCWLDSCLEQSVTSKGIIKQNIISLSNPTHSLVCEVFTEYLLTVWLFFLNLLWRYSQLIIIYVSGIQQSDPQFLKVILHLWATLVAHMVKNLPVMWETHTRMHSIYSYYKILAVFQIYPCSIYTQ